MKTGLDWYKRKPTAFLGGVQGMSAREIAVYTVVIELIYQHGGPIHNAPKWISGWISDMGSSAVRTAISDLVNRGKLYITNAGEIHNKPAENQLKTTEKLSENREKTGRKGGINSGKSRRDTNENNDISEATGEADKIREDKKRKDEEPPIPPVIPETARQRALVVRDEFSAEFDRIWPHYPRRVAVARARTAWLKARVTTPFEEIAGPLRAAIRVWRNGTPVDRIPHFSSWLNGQCWLDTPEHAANRPRTSTEDLDRLSRISLQDELAALMPPTLRIVSQ